MRHAPQHEAAPQRAGRRRLRRVLAWTVILLGVGLVVLTVVVPRVAGATPYVVLTGSMAPHLPPGTLVVVRPVDASDVRTGDVVTYQVRSGEPVVVTHRVVGKGVGAGGEVVLRTRGDANGAADELWVRPVQLRGEVWYDVPHIGRVSNLLSVAQRNQGARLVGLGLLGYAAFQLLGAWRARRGRVAPPAARVDAAGPAGPAGPAAPAAPAGPVAPDRRGVHV
ncbi:signal peptidase I [Nocardioides sp.]|uniref:signal peptidase I n=1 Tax=Nocardioides sp. TaxID=35761 RepID=UPI00286B754D|nr:signal peptidase I [Nocardioides sp.]